MIPELSRVVWIAVACVFAMQSYAVDVIPGNLVPPPPGLNVVMLSYQTGNLGERYREGENLGQGSKVETRQFLPRYNRTFAIQSSPAVVYIQPTLAKLKPKGSLSNLESKSGLGDTAMAFAVWPYTNTKAGEYLAAAIYALFPMGEYDSDDALNLGQNRYSSAFQVGYQRRLLEDVDGMLVSDVQWFGSNDDSPVLKQELEQDLLYSSQASLMLHPDGTTMLAISLFFVSGGETTLNGIEQNDRIKKRRYQLALRKRFDFGQITLQYGRDHKTQNGFIEDKQLILRYQLAWK